MGKNWAVVKRNVKNKAFPDLHRAWRIPIWLYIVQNYLSFTLCRKYNSNWAKWSKDNEEEQSFSGFTLCEKNSRFKLSEMISALWYMQKVKFKWGKIEQCWKVNVKNNAKLFRVHIVQKEFGRYIMQKEVIPHVAETLF